VQNPLNFAALRVPALRTFSIIVARSASDDVVSLRINGLRVGQFAGSGGRAASPPAEEKTVVEQRFD
jgi:hypothetical protein